MRRALCRFEISNEVKKCACVWAVKKNFMPTPKKIFLKSLLSFREFAIIVEEKSESVLSHDEQGARYV